MTASGRGGRKPPAAPAAARAPRAGSGDRTLPASAAIGSGSESFGFVGLLIAVPLASAIGVLTRFALRTYYASSLYASTATKPPLKS